MKWCTNCGAQLKDEEKYCSKCGAKQDADSISENVEKKENKEKVDNSKKEQKDSKYQQKKEG